MGLEDVVITPPKNEAEIFNFINCENSIDSVIDLKDLNLVTLKTLVGNEKFYEKHGYFHEFLERSTISFISTPTEPRNPDLEARVQKLKAEQNNMEYRKMTKNLGAEKKLNISFREEVKSANAQIAAVINFVLTVGGSFLFVYKAVEYALPEQNIPAQVLMAVLTSTAVAIADLYFLIRTI